VSTGFSAGVMLYVSFVEIFYKGVDALAEAYGDYWGYWINTASFFGAMFLIGIIDNLIPSAQKTLGNILYEAIRTSIFSCF
jgi:ZIP family zinc transporter